MNTNPETPIPHPETAQASSVSTNLQAHETHLASDSTLDCVIIGAGPAGLTALEYLARFHRTAVAVGAGGPRPRLTWIDRTYNLPGYPEGVPGSVLLARLREQAEAMGGRVLAPIATRIDGENGDFRVTLEDETVLRARKIILAMGVRDRVPEIPNIEKHLGHFVRFCPVCDGYEHTDKNLGIVGFGPSVARHALFLQTFSNRITIFTHGREAETLGRYRKALDERGIGVYQSRIERIAEGAREVGETDYVGNGVCLEDGTYHELAVLYGALGCDLHLESVEHLGLQKDEDGYLIADINQETSLPGMYAAGDLVSQINQISVAFGQATIAAVRIHNALDDEGF